MSGLMIKRTVAQWLRRFADRIDDAGAPRSMGWSFTFENRRGLVFNDNGRGCPLWYLSHDDYDRAHSEALFPGRRIDWARLGEQGASYWEERAAANAAESYQFIAKQMRRIGYDEDQIRDAQEAARRMFECPNKPEPGRWIVDHSECCSTPLAP